MLTIGQLAAYAGATVRAVRHYHAIGLLTEPERDASGYRRYDASAVVELVRIRTLADAGVPLSRVRELLAAEPCEFAAAVADIDRRLRAEIRAKQRHRQRISRLTAGDGLALPRAVVDYLERLRSLGIPEEGVASERDGWILISAHSPDQVEEWVTRKSRNLDDPEYVALTRDFGSLASWSSDDPRIGDLAHRLVAYGARLLEVEGPDALQTPKDVFEGQFADLLDALAVEQAPAVLRLAELLSEHGWNNWNRAGDA